MTYLDALVPPVPDPWDLLERLRKLGMRDDGSQVDPGPLDEATLNLVRRVITATRDDLVLELPRGRHDFAVLLGIYLQLMRCGAQRRGDYGPDAFAGPVVVIGLNVNLTDRLRRIRIGAQSLSEALQARRVRADGTVTDLHGTVTPASAWRDGLLYLNTSLGWPTLPGTRPGIAIIDRTTFRNPATLDRALGWCSAQHAARVIVLGSQGEAPPRDMPGSSGWLRWAWTPGLRRDAIRELGAAPCCGPLSTNPLTVVTPRPVTTAVFTAPAVSRLRRRCLAAIAAARRVGGPFPQPVADAIQLVNLLGSLWGHVSTADAWAAADPRGISAASLARSVRQARGQDFRGSWSTFADIHWPDFRYDALQLTELVTAYNPKFDMLITVLDWAWTARPGARIVVRAHSRAAAGALRQDLAAADPQLASVLGDTDSAEGGIAVLPYSLQRPWATSPALELHAGVPAPWQRAVLLSGEAAGHMVVADADEDAWLRTVVAAADREWRTALQGTAQALGLVIPTLTHIATVSAALGPVAIDGRGEDSDASADTAPTIDLQRIFADYSAAVTQADSQDTDGVGRAAGAGRFTLARLVTLEPGDTVYWLPSDGRVEILTGTRYSTTPVAGLTAGLALLIPRGESRGELYARLVQAAHKDCDVMAVTMLLHRFRRAMYELYDRYGSWPEVAAVLRSRGSSVQPTGAACRLWATGEVIAPDDVTDIRRVARLIWDDSLSADRAWERIGRVAEELRRLHRELGRLLSRAIAEAACGQPGPSLHRLSQLCGVDAAEILEEFEVRRIRAVGPPASVPVGQLRRPLSAELGQHAIPA